MTSQCHNQGHNQGHNPGGDQGHKPDPRETHLDAARASILDVGWRRTTLTEVARRAGVSRMTIYRTWQDMPALLADLMTREWGDVIGAAAALDDGTPDPAGIATAMVRAASELRENELFVRIVELDPELLLPYLFARRGRSQQQILDLLEGVIAAGQDARTVRTGDPSVIARSLLLALHGFVLSAHTMLDERVDQTDLDTELHAVLTRALSPTGAC